MNTKESVQCLQDWVAELDCNIIISPVGVTVALVRCGLRNLLVHQAELG